MKGYKKLLPAYALVLAGLLFVTVFANRTVTVVSERAPIRNRSTIIIDAGHGGVDGGATSCTGILESQFNLEISLRLCDLIHLLGYRTKMIRTTDCSIYTSGDTIAAKKISDLKERVRIVNETENGILISIHQNYFSDSRYDGAQVFYAKSEASRELAGRLQNMLIQTLNHGSRRRAKKADGIYLMEHIDQCGVLVECGFLSNEKEEAKLREPEYQKELCCVIACALSQYKNPPGNRGI